MPGWYFKDGSTQTGVHASKPPTYPTQAGSKSSAKRWEDKGWENPEDLDGDGDIDEDDYKLYESAKRWEELGWDNPEDLNGDGIIDIEDYKLYVQGDRWDDKKEK